MEEINTQNLSSTPRRMTRSQSISPPQHLELPSLKKRKSMASKCNDSIVEESIEDQEVGESVQVKALEPITEMDVVVSGPHTQEIQKDDKSLAENSKSVVFNETIITDDAVTKTVYPKTPMNLKGTNAMSKDMDISNFNDSFGQDKNKENKPQQGDHDIDMDISLLKQGLAESSTPIFSIKLKRFRTPENEEKTPSSLKQQQQQQEIGEKTIASSSGKKEGNNMKNSSIKSYYYDDDDYNNVDELNKNKTKSLVKKSNSLLLQSFENQKDNSLKGRKSLTKTVLQYSDDEKDIEKSTPQKSSEDVNSKKTPQSQEKATPVKSPNKSQSLLLNFFNKDGKLPSSQKRFPKRTSDANEHQNNNKSNSTSKPNTPKERRNSLKTVYVDVDDIDDCIDEDQEITQQNNNDKSISSKLSATKKRKKSLIIVDVDTDDGVEKELEISTQNNNNTKEHSSKENTPKKRTSKQLSYMLDDVGNCLDKDQGATISSYKANTPKERRSSVRLIHMNGIDHDYVGNKNQEEEATKQSNNNNNSISSSSKINTPKKRKSFSNAIDVDINNGVDKEQEVSKQNNNNTKESSSKKNTPDVDEKQTENTNNTAAEKSEINENGKENKSTDSVSEKEEDQNMEEKLSKSLEILNRASLRQSWGMAVSGKVGDKIDYIENNRKSTPKKLNESLNNASLGSNKKRKSKSLLLTNSQSLDDNKDVNDTVEEVYNYFNNEVENEEENVSKIDAIDETEKEIAEDVDENSLVVTEKKKRKSRPLLQVLSDDDDDDDIDNNDSNVGNETEREVENYFRLAENDEDEELAEHEKPYRKNIFFKSSVIEVDEEYVSGDSMDSEERAEIEDNELLHDGESLGSQDTDIDEPDDGEDDENDSFIESDKEMELLDTDDDVENEDEISINESTSQKKKRTSFNRIVSGWSDSEEEQVENEKDNEEVNENNDDHSEEENQDDEDQNEPDEDEGDEIDENNEDENDEDDEKNASQEYEEEEADQFFKNPTLDTSSKKTEDKEQVIDNENNEGGYFNDGASSAGATCSSSSVTNRGTLQGDNEVEEGEEGEIEAVFSNDDDEVNNDPDTEENIPDQDKASENEKEQTILSISNTRRSFSKTDSGVVIFKASQSFVEMDDDKEELKKRKRMSRSFCAGESPDISSMLMQHQHKKSKVIQPTNEENEEAMKEEEEEEGKVKEEEVESEQLVEANKNAKHDKIEAKQVKSGDEERHLRIQARIEEMLEVANKAKLEAKLKAKKNAVKMLHSKKKKQKLVEKSTEETQMESKSSPERAQEKAQTKEAVHKALKASADIIFKKDKQIKQILLNKFKEDNLKNQRCHDEIVRNESNMKNNKNKVTKELRVTTPPIRTVKNKLLTAAGEVAILPVTPPPNHKKNRVQEIKLSTGVVRVEPSSPVSKRVVKKTNVGILREDPGTPHTIGFKVRQILNYGQDDVPELTHTDKHGKKRKRVMTEITYSLPQPQWTASGVFKVETQQKVFKASTGKKVLVASLSPNGEKNSLNKKHMKKQHNNNSNNNNKYFGGAIESALQFKKQVLQRKDVPRESPLDLINRKKRQELKLR